MDESLVASRDAMDDVDDIISTSNSFPNVEELVSRLTSKNFPLFLFTIISAFKTIWAKKSQLIEHLKNCPAKKAYMV